MIRMHDITDAEATVTQIVTTLARRQEVENVTLESSLKNDLGFDSLTMLEMCVEIEKTFDNSIEDKFGSIKTVGDIVALVDNNGIADCDTLYNIEDYPLPKTPKQIKRLKRIMEWLRLLYHLNTVGAENVPLDKNFILCPNHTSTFDSLWIWAVLGFDKVDPNKICGLAKHEFIKKKSTNIGMALFGGIPVDRNGNTIPAIKRCIECLKNENYSLIIHPEGTVSRDGKIHEFKGGAAKIAIESGVDIVPVKIEGSVAKVKRGLAVPKIFNWKKMRRHKISIYFGNPISPKGKSADELTKAIQAAVEELGNE